MPPCNKQQTIELDSTTWTALKELALAIHASHGVDTVSFTHLTLPTNYPV